MSHGHRNNKPLRHDLVALTLAAAATAISMNANAAVDIFAKIGDIKGESRDDKHKAEIDVLSWSWGVVGGKKKTAPCGFEMAIDKHVDAASPRLMASTVSGTMIQTAVLTVRKRGDNQVEFLTITMNNVIVTSVAPSVDGATNRLAETTTLAYASATISYKPQKDDGSLGGAITATVPASCPP